MKKLILHVLKYISVPTEHKEIYVGKSLCQICWIKYNIPLPIPKPIKRETIHPARYSEKEQRRSPDNRQIRLDVYAVDEDDVIYEVEAQKENTHNLPK